MIRLRESCPDRGGRCLTRAPVGFVRYGFGLKRMRGCRWEEDCHAEFGKHVRWCLSEVLQLLGRRVSATVEVN